MKSKFLQKQKLLNKLSIALLSFTFFSTNAQADCTVSSSISSGNFLATYGSCSGKLIIPSGVVLEINTVLTLPSSITELVIEDGGQIFMDGNNAELHVDANTVITIENTTNTNISSPTAAIYVNQACNNNKAIYIGTLKYSACTGGGNVCLLFTHLVEQGGSLSIDPIIKVSGVALSGNQLCTSTPANTSFQLQGELTNNSSFTQAPTFAWSLVSQPNGVTTPNILNPTQELTSIEAFGLGTYVFRVTVTQNLSAGTCATTVNQVKYADITIDIKENPTVGISGGGILSNDADPVTSATVTFTGSGGNPEYTIAYNLNNVAQTPITTTANNYSFTKYSNDNVGEYIYTITSITDGTCAVTTTGLTRSIEIIIPTSITIADFKVEKTNCDNIIKWAATDTRQFSHFEIEKSIDGKSYESIAVMNYIDNETNYEVIDQFGGRSKAFYRLKAINQDLSFEYSKLAQVKQHCFAPKNINTIATGTYIIKGLSEGEIVTIKNNSGQIIESFSATNNETRIDLNQFTKGVYFITVYKGGEVTFSKQLNN